MSPSKGDSGESVDFRENYKLDTNGRCLFCFKSVSLRENSVDGNNGESEISAITVLLQCLGVNLTEVLTTGNTEITRLHPNLQVVLCRECTEVSSKASELLLALDKLRMELDYYMAQIRRRIDQAKDASWGLLKSKNKNRRSGNPDADNHNNEVVDRLLSLLLSKCEQISSKTPQPKVILDKINFNLSYPKYGSATLTHQNSTATPSLIDTVKTEWKTPAALPSPVSVEVDLKTKLGRGSKRKKNFHKSVSLNKRKNRLKTGASKESSLQCNFPGCSKTCTSKGYLSLHKKLKHAARNAKQENFLQNKGDGNSSENDGDCLARITERDEDTNKISFVNTTTRVATSPRENKKATEIRIRLLNPAPASVEAITKSARRNVKVTCNICNKSLGGIDSLRRHKRYTHDRKKSFECDNCGKIFYNQQNLKRHVDSVHIKIKFKCSFPNCSLMAAGASELRRHQKYAHSAVMQADGSIIRVEDLQRLYQEKQKAPASANRACDICVKIFDSYEGLRQHQWRRHRRIYSKCSFPGCSRKYVKEENLINHYKAMHSGFNPSCVNVRGGTTKKGKAADSAVNEKDATSMLHEDKDLSVVEEEVGVCNFQIQDGIFDDTLIKTEPILPD